MGIAVVGSAPNFEGLGVDVERDNREVQDAAARLVCTPRERAWADDAADPADRYLRRLAVFCGKEAIFKALFPIEGVYLGFSDAELAWRTQPAGFVGELRKAAGRSFPAGTKLDIRCALVADLLVSAVAVPRVLR